MPQSHQPQIFSTRLCSACGRRCFDISTSTGTSTGTPTSTHTSPTVASSASTATDRTRAESVASSLDYTGPRPLDLLEKVFATCNSNPPPTVVQARQFAHSLGLGASGDYQGYKWDVGAHSYLDLAPNRLPLPEKQKHSGNFEWIGCEKEAYPQYLWDSVNFETVEATHERLQNYCAVSWTWGRYQQRNSDGTAQWRRSTGVKWRVPVLPKIESRFSTRALDRLTHLKHLLKKIKAFRYFWVDVLCINQNGDRKARAEKKTEISKQAQIFQNATASIAYLWSLDERTSHDLSLALGAFGGLLASCIYFRPDQPFLGASSFVGSGIYPPHDQWENLFARLQEDKWFTSLWALQEMVLFPSAIWMTQDGGIATINERPVTTTLFASAVRLLQKMAEIRNMQWIMEEKLYVQRVNVNPARFFKLRKELSDIEHKRKLALQEERGKELAYRNNADLCIEMSYGPRTPSVLRHRSADRPLLDEIERWINWSCGKAGIDICQGASRTAILIAGSNREVVDNQSKEYALLAALKIAYHEKLIPEELLEVEERHFSHVLLNIILRQEGSAMFDVVHQSFTPEFKTLSDNLLDTSDWAMVPPVFPYTEVAIPSDSTTSRKSRTSKTVRRTSDEELAQEWTTITRRYEHLQNEVRYHQNGHEKYVVIPRQRDLLLTDMSPWKARYPNYKSPNQETSTDIILEDSKGWHMHPSGKVHILPSARIQDISDNFNSTEIKIRFNGGQVEYDIYRSSDLKLIWTTQKWLHEKLGKAQFILLPLYTYRRCSRKSPMTNKGSVGDYHDHENDETFSVGVVLVGKSHLRMDQPLATFYKLGTYTGKGPFTSLGWKAGIIVTSPHEEARTSGTRIRDECQELTSVATLVTHSLLDMAIPMEEDFETIRPSELLERTRTREALAPG